MTGTVECPLTSGGTQTLLLYSPSDSPFETMTGSFRTYAQQMTAPQYCTNLTVGGSAGSGSVAKAGDVACFTFAGTYPNNVTVTITGLTGTLSPEIACFRPTGAPTIDPIGESVECPVNTTGDQTILVYDSAGPGTGAFSLAVST